MFRSLTLLLAVVLLGGAFSVELGRERKVTQERDRLTRQLEVATGENERLRALVAGEERARRLERTKAVRAEIEHEVADIRGLAFKQPVEYASVSRREIKATFSKALGEDFSEQEFADLGRAWQRLGLLPKPLDLRQTLLDLLSEQVAAFYQQHEHKLYLFEETTLETSYDRMLLAHELTHALQDQHFGIKNLPLALKDNDDRALAALAIIEGDATEVMTVYMARHVSMKAVLESAGTVMSQRMEQLQKVPHFLRDRLTFPYLQGKNFVAAVEGAAESVDELYRVVPSSTMQILHPEKYVRGPQEPVAITWPEVAWRGQKPTMDNVVGEAGVQALFTEWADAKTASVAATGWRGDRYLSYAEEDALVWKTVWADEANAREFIEAESKALARRYGGSVPPSVEGRQEFAGARTVRLIAQPTEHGVVLIDAATPAAAQQLEEQFGR